jgi:hypothetical protein
LPIKSTSPPLIRTRFIQVSEFHKFLRVSIYRLLYDLFDVVNFTMDVYRYC